MCRDARLRRSEVERRSSDNADPDIARPPTSPPKVLRYRPEGCRPGRRGRAGQPFQLDELKKTSFTGDGLSRSISNITAILLYKKAAPPDWSKRSGDNELVIGRMTEGRVPLRRNGCPTTRRPVRWKRQSTVCSFGRDTSDRSQRGHNSDTRWSQGVLQNEQANTQSPHGCGGTSRLLDRRARAQPGGLSDHQRSQCRSDWRERRSWR